MAKHHYISKFHLMKFVDPASIETPEPWLWIGDAESGQIRRRSPKNVARESDLFSKKYQSGETLEEILSYYVETDAGAIWPEDLEDLANLPEQVWKYLAWASARSKSNWKLAESWVNETRRGVNITLEKPLDVFHGVPNDPRDLLFFDRTNKKKILVAPSEAVALNPFRYDLIFQKSDFLDYVYIQARYYFERFFPRLKWFGLSAPIGRSFVLSDRVFVFGDPEIGFKSPPYILRKEGIISVVPISSSLAIIGCNEPIKSISVDAVNAITASGAISWIVAANEDEIRAFLPLHQAQ